jgi:hypothetical protein
MAPRTFPPTLRAFALFLLLASFIAGGCGGSSAPEEARSPSMDMAGAASPEPPGAYPAAESAAPAPPGGMAEAKDAGGKGKKEEEVGTWKRSKLVPNTSRLMIGDREQLPLRGMQTKVTIDGFRARVILDCHFMNDRDGQFEGTFQLRLPDDASPFFFAFGQNAVAAVAGPVEAPRFFTADEARRMGAEPLQLMADRSASWTGVREARMVPNEKAAFAYTETVHRRVDPALMEWSGAGVFSARVFPIMPRKLHRIVIGYDVDLLRAGEEFEYKFDLPENVPSAVIDLNVGSTPNSPVKIAPETKPLVVGKRLHFRFEEPKDKTIALRVKPAQGAYISGNDPKTGTYFATAIRPDLPANEATTGAGQAVFLLDTSLSSSPDRFNIWLKMMQRILDKNRDSLKKFAVLFFNIEATWYKPQFTDNTPENVQALLATANNLSLEGATDVASALAEGARPAWASGDANRWDLFLLSDGASTWGESDLYAMSKSIGAGSGRTLFAYQTGLAGTDIGTLNHLVRESGGAVFSVVGESEIDKAAVAHRQRPWQLAEIKVPGVSDVLVAGRLKAIFPGQAIILAGRGTPDAKAEVLITLERDGARRITKVPVGAAIASELAPRLYGQVATRQLEDLGDATEEPSKAYAMHFRVVGKTCSLLMLETEQDYLRFNIKPEEHAGFVASRPASTLIQAVLAQASKLLGDPRVAFMTWLRKMRTMPGVELALPPQFETALAALPATSFEVSAPRASAKLRDKKDVPAGVQSLLASRQLDYDVLTGESQRRLKQFGSFDALRAMSSLVEEQPGDGVLARDVGFSAMEWGLHGQAYHLFRRVAATRPYEPQTYRALAQSLIALGKIDLAIAYFEVGLHGRWQPRFGEFRQILALDYLRLLRRIDRGEAKTLLGAHTKTRVGEIERQFNFGRPDLVVMITWNTDNTDVDLHVIEPSGEECYYSHRRTAIGGSLTQDVTQGYGPEMYTLTGGPSGRFLVRAHYFASDRNRMSARTKVYATIIEGWGTPKERVTEKVVTLELGKQVHDIALVNKGPSLQVAGP